MHRRIMAKTKTATPIGISLLFSKSAMNLLLLLQLMHLILILQLQPAQSQQQLTTSTYMVNTEPTERPSVYSTVDDWHASLVSNPSKISFQYKFAFHGFAAELTAAEAEQMEAKPGVISLLEETLYDLHTTRSPAFLNLAPLSSVSDGGRGVIIGVLDTGAWPASLSFNDAGMPPAPARWRGACEGGTGFACNNKIIGARFFTGQSNVTEKSRTALDTIGHGTHTGSTAAGSAVPGAGVFGYGNGTAQGMAPHSWLAVYKVCAANGCPSSRILAGFDAAIADGVDVLSISLGSSGPLKFYSDPIAIGAFAALRRGIFVASSAGNDGPERRTVGNYAPWLTTVGATSLDRAFPGLLATADGLSFRGSAVFSGTTSAVTGHAPLITGRAAVAAGEDADLASRCFPTFLDAEKVKGKVVMCEDSSNVARHTYVVLGLGGVGVVEVLSNDTTQFFVQQVYELPTIVVDYATGEALKAYIAGAKGTAAGTIRSEGTVLGVKPAPVVATFSSRGPSPLSDADVLKPDMVAPGVSIVAAWSGAVSPTGETDDRRRSAFNIDSGTSMACPHVAGIAALLKAARPAWSAGAVRSALMTTAYVTANDGRAIVNEESAEPATAYDVGAGHVAPAAALDPGLVYEVEDGDYVGYLCRLNYTDSHLRRFGIKPADCAGTATTELNYPSFTVVLGAGGGRVTQRRTVTNVGSATVTYRVSVRSATGVGISVQPSVLLFSKVGERKQFSVTFSAQTAASASNETVFGAVVWSDGAHSVRSPVVISFAS